MSEQVSEQESAKEQSEDFDYLSHIPPTVKWLLYPDDDDEDDDQASSKSPHFNFNLS